MENEVQGTDVTLADLIRKSQDLYPGVSPEKVLVQHDDLIHLGEGKWQYAFTLTTKE